MKGFTLLELVLVIAIVAILSIAILPRLDLSPSGVDAAARKIRSDILYAQSLAMSRGTAHGLLFQAGGPYVIYQGSPATPVTDPLTRSVFSEDLNRFYRTGVVNDYQVEFDTMGRPTLGGGGSLIIRNGAVQKTISVRATTGSVTIQ
ncbi:MAG: prepilin-type N-terminal cleavage/methylation domain-containing protein [Deltaproteobacteria bacterium]|nr:prepilin-type N-terminal cleavage/methylation domain-containing protein [Deltaproteobacteria bacterium]